MIQTPGAIARVPKLFEGKTAALLASGPSLTPRQVWECAQAGWALFGCNNQCIYALDVLWAPDMEWLDIVDPRRVEHIPHRFTTATRGQRQQRQNPPRFRANWQYLETDPNIVWSDMPSKLARGQHAGYQLINLAGLAGCKRLVLLGYDGRRVKQADGTRARHWFGVHPGHLNKKSKFDEFNQNYLQLPDTLADRGIEVINATENSAIEAFERASLADCINRWA